MQTSLKLYYSTQTRATRARWALEELGVPYELVRLDLGKKEQKQPEYLAIHPLGQVPALLDGDVPLIESVAICMHLADRFPDGKLAPPVGSVERGVYYQWCLFSTATIEANLIQYLTHTRRLPEEQRNAQLAAEAKANLDAALKVLSGELDEQQYLLGQSFSMVDVIVGSAVIWGTAMGAIAGFANLDGYCERLKQRPAFLKAYAD